MKHIYLEPSADVRVILGLDIIAASGEPAPAGPTDPDGAGEVPAVDKGTIG